MSALNSFDIFSALFFHTVYGDDCVCTVFFVVVVVAAATAAAAVVVSVFVVGTDILVC